QNQVPMFLVCYIWTMKRLKSTSPRIVVMSCPCAAWPANTVMPPGQSSVIQQKLLSHRQPILKVGLSASKILHLFTAIQGPHGLSPVEYTTLARRLKRRCG